MASTQGSLWPQRSESTPSTVARVMLTQVLSAGDVIAIAPQVLAEFIDVVTDPRRFTQPLDMNAARHVAKQWWTSSDVVQAFPDAGAVRQFLTWMQQFSLGRKRLLDTLLAASYWQAGIQSLLTTNQPWRARPMPRTKSQSLT